MKGTSVQAFTRLAAKIHPVSLSKQESSRLLTALTSSFEKHLDAAHPIPHGHDQAKQKVQALGRVNGVHDRPATYTDQFFASVLTNPIIATRTEDSISDKLLRTKLLQKDPMRLFDQYAAAGSATPEVALLCLETFERALYKGQDKGVDWQRARQTEILETQAGFNILRWLWSSRYQDSDIFTRDMRLVNIMVKFLVAEGREEMVWRWFGRSEGRVLIQGQYISPKASILRSLVKAHLSAGSSTGLEAALQSYFKANDWYRAEESPSLPRHRLLKPSALRLTQALKGANLSAKSRPTLLLLYDRFLQSSMYGLVLIDNPLILDIITLKLRHPIIPDPSEALALVRSLRKSPDHDFFSPTLRPKLLGILFETVKMLQEKDNHEDAAWVMEFMCERFADDLEDRRKQYSDSEQAASQLADPVDRSAERTLGFVSYSAVPG